MKGNYKVIQRFGDYVYHMKCSQSIDPTGFKQYCLENGIQFKKRKIGSTTHYLSYVKWALENNAYPIDFGDRK